nr:Uncharacterised protein [Klebsiella pneumoniae]
MVPVIIEEVSIIFLFYSAVMTIKINSQDALFNFV